MRLRPTPFYSFQTWILKLLNFSTLSWFHWIFWVLVANFGEILWNFGLNIIFKIILNPKVFRNSSNFATRIQNIQWNQERKENKKVANFEGKNWRQKWGFAPVLFTVLNLEFWNLLTFPHFLDFIGNPEFLLQNLKNS